MQTASRSRAWPRWARIAAPVAAVTLGLGVVGVATADGDEDKTATAEVLGLTVTTAPVLGLTEATVPGAASSAYLERPASDIPPNETPIRDCHPSYEPCLPNTSDVDCVGGEEDGPWYTGRVKVIGPDVYDLDHDRNGVGCE